MKGASAHTGLPPQSPQQEVFTKAPITLEKQKAIFRKYELNSTLKKVEEHVFTLPPDSTLIVFDNDGTLNDRSMPANDTTRPRGNAVPFVSSAVEKGYKVVIASAWPNFDDTIRCLHETGLTAALKLNCEVQKDIKVIKHLKKKIGCMSIACTA